MPKGQEYCMCVRNLFIARYLQGEGSVASLAREMRIHRATAHNWIKRYIDGGYEGLKPSSRRPRITPHRTPGSLESHVVSLREEYPRWGARKLMHLLRREGIEPPSERTVNRILKRNGLVVQRDRRAEAPNRFERDLPNELWQMDHKRSMHFGYGERTVPFVVIDDATRFLIGVDLNPDKGLESTWASLWSMFGLWGLPDAILSDNAHLFAGHDGPSRLESRLIRLGIKVLHGRVGHPQTQGKVERVNGTIEYELLSTRHWRNADDLRPVLVDWIDTYNLLRPHEALDNDVPASRYLPSAKPRPENVPPMIYQDGEVLRKIACDGRFSYKGARYEAGRGLAGQKVAVDEVDDVLEVRYGEIIIAKYDLRPKRNIKISRCND